MAFIVFLAGVLVVAGAFAVRAAVTRSMGPLIEGGIGALSGLVAGLLWGAGARVVMRIVALIDGRETELSGGGVLIILIAGITFGVPLGMLFAAVRRWLPGARLRKGLTFGAGIYALLVVPLAILGASDLDRSVWTAPVLISTGLFGALSIAYGLAVEATMERCEHWLPQPPPTARPTAAGQPERRTSLGDTYA